jgi:hypothetical protein
MSCNRPRGELARPLGVKRPLVSMWEVKRTYLAKKIIAHKFHFSLSFHFGCTKGDSWPTCRSMGYWGPIRMRLPFTWGQFVQSQPLRVRKLRFIISHRSHIPNPKSQGPSMTWMHNWRWGSRLVLRVGSNERLDLTRYISPENFLHKVIKIIVQWTKPYRNWFLESQKLGGFPSMLGLGTWDPMRTDPHYTC